MDIALLAVDQNRVAVHGLAGDALGLDDQRDRQRPRHDRGMAADRAFFEHHAAQPPAVIEQFARADISRDQDGILGDVGLVDAVAPGEDPQQAVRQVVEVVQPVADIGVRHPRHAGPRLGLLALHRHLGGETGVDALVHPPYPALVMGEHAPGVEHVAMLAGGGKMVGIEHVVEVEPQLLQRLVQALLFGRGIVGDGVGHHDLRVVQQHRAFGCAFLTDHALDHVGLLMQRRQIGLGLAGEGAQLGHLGDHHRHDLEPVHLVLGVLTRCLVLDHQDAQHLAQALDRHAQERGVDLFARLGAVLEAGGMRRVVGGDGLGGVGDPAHQALAQAHPGLVHGGLLQAGGRAQLQRVGLGL